jgi:hypothetical protein
MKKYILLSLPFSLKIRTDQLWIIVILAGFLFYASLVPLPPNDFWWHLKIGEIIHTQHQIPDSNMFSWTLPADYPMVYGAWLAEYLFYALHKIGGLELLIFLRNILVAITFGLVGYEAYSRGRSWRIAAFVTAIACMMVINNLPLRPQIWSWLPFVLYLILLSRYSRNKINRYWLLLIPLIMIFWVNAHGAFILGIVLLVVFLAGEILSTIGKSSSIHSANNILWLGIISFFTLIATTVNPRFINIFSYVLDLMTDTPSQRLVEEWQSPTPHGFANIIFYISILLILVVLTISHYKATITELLLITGFLWLAWSGQRYVIWFGIVSMPILAEAITKLSIEIPELISSKHLLNTIIAIFLFVPVLMVQPWFIENAPLPETYWAQVIKGSSEGPLINTDTPISSVEYLKKFPGGRLFNEMGYGSYMNWAIPEQGVFVDPRVELYPYEQWQDYLNISRSIMYEELLEKYQITRIIVNKKNQPNLSIVLSKDQNWELEYEDDYSQIWNNGSP